MSNHITHVTDSTFEQEVLQADKPVLVDYWAEWCGPCKLIGPIVEDIAAEYADTLKVCKMDIDANPVTPTQYSVRGIPTLTVFKHGQAEASKVGALSKAQLKTFLDGLL